MAKSRESLSTETPPEPAEATRPEPTNEPPPAPADKPKKTRNPELRAMEQIHSIVSKFDPDAAFRIINWVVGTIHSARQKANQVPPNLNPVPIVPNEGY